MAELNNQNVTHHVNMSISITKDELDSLIAPTAPSEIPVGLLAQNNIDFSGEGSGETLPEIKLKLAKSNFEVFDSFCFDDLVSCADIFDGECPTKNEKNFAKVSNYIRKCRKTCGLCDKNLACPELVENCDDKSVREMCPSSCLT